MNPSEAAWLITTGGDIVRASKAIPSMYQFSAGCGCGISWFGLFLAKSEEQYNVLYAGLLVAPFHRY